MAHANEGEGGVFETRPQMSVLQKQGSALFLRSLLSPLRLLSAAMWHMVQQEAVLHYGMLEEVVSLITDTVPDLLSYRQKAQLTMGLRAKLVLELCGMGSPADTDSIQAHLQRIETLVALHKEMESGDTQVEESGANFVVLMQILMKDPAERSIFFKDVYPSQYGEKFNTALQKLMRWFLSRLENAFPQPTIEEAAHLLNTTPTVMEECVQSLSQPEQIKNVLKYQREISLEIKETTQLCSPSPDDCILNFLGRPQLVQTPSDTHSEPVIEYVPPYCQEVQVESLVITQYIQNELETSISEENNDGVQYDAEETKQCDPVDTTNSAESAYEDIDSLHLHTVGIALDERSEKQDPVEVGVVAMETVDGGESKEKKEMAKNPKETIDLVKLYTLKEPFGKLDKLDLCDGQFSKTFNPEPPKRNRGRPKKHPRNKTTCKKKQEEKTVAVPSSSVNKPTGLKNGVSSIVAVSKKNTLVKGESGKYACSLCSFQDPEEIQLHHHLFVHHPEEYKKICEAEDGKDPQEDKSTPHEIQISPANKVRSYRGVPVCKTCPTCNKTFTRSSDMRRHQVSHTVDRPFICWNCGKTFRYTFDLRRHQQCAHKDYVVVYQERGEATEDGSVEIKVDDSRVVPQDLHNCSENAECLSSGSVISAGSGIQPDSMTSTERPDVSDVLEPTHGLKSVQVNSPSRRHLRSPSANHPHKCSQCGKGFKYSYNLKKHEDICEGKLQHAGSAQCLSKEQESDTSEHGTSVSAAPTLQEKICLNKQEQQESAAQFESFLTYSQCEKKYKDTCSLITHKQVCTSTERYFKCIKCDALFKTVLDIQKHAHIHWGEDHLQCSHCGKYCLSQSDLARHKLVHEQENKHPCTLCSETLERLDSLREHYHSVHDFTGPYQCSKCDKTHPDLKVIVKHIKTHSEERPFQCSHCSKSFKQRSALTVHAKIHSGDKPFLCEECGKCFSSNISLQRHSVSHKTERPYSCPQCKNCFKTSYAMHSHLLKHTTGARVSCEFCGKMFFRASALHRHHRTHTGERPYGCPKCGKTFLTKGEVAKHMRYHTGERPFRCTLCSKTFTQTCYLSVHMRIHTGERPYTCSICNRAFICNTHLKRHTLVHTQERPFKCDCGKAFNQAHSLKVHNRTPCQLQEKSI
ncbi:zinc finger protein 14-like isoform X1 [Silurus meridionalis]|uniref:zinc finger protein 14-like isoform X1 n=1 Tax=Silurus meridionalis TaxID=175797 RepID=UPI001EEBF67D|nr:zinc finger protein 14-like isoform X1 [Silurus meridionalis]